MACCVVSCILSLCVFVIILAMSPKGACCVVCHSSLFCVQLHELSWSCCNYYQCYLSPLLILVSGEVLYESVNADTGRHVLLCPVSE